MTLDLPLVEVEWLDASSMGGWHELEFYQAQDIMHCRTTGYLSKKTETAIQLIQTVSENAVTECMTIPMAAVTNIIIHREGGETNGSQAEGRKEGHHTG